jgi:hypothetical protein
MKRMTGSLSFAVIISIMAGGAALAGTNDPVIQQRELNQEQRIQQGVNSGQVTPREAGRLDAQQVRIQQQESRMKSDGQLTGRERDRLTREQNRASRNIYRKKHNVRNVNTN